MLFRIAYWWPKSKVFRNGHYWYARRRTEWMEDSGLSRNKLDRAIGELRELDLIETAQFKWYGDPVLHVRLTTKGQEIAHVSHPGETQDSQFAETPKSYHGERLDGIDSAQSAIFGEADASQLDFPGEVKEGYSREGKEINSKPSLTGKAGKTEEGFISKSEPKPQPISEAELNEVMAGWRSGVEARGRWLPEFTHADRRRFKQLIAQVPKGQAAAIVAGLVEHWAKVAKAIELETGFKVPTEPQIWFVLRFLDVAVEAQANASKPKEKVKVNLMAL